MHILTQFRNTTLPCETGFLERAMQLEQYVWEPSNLTRSCTEACSQAVQSWVDSVTASCAQDVMRQDGHLIQPKTLPLIYQHQYQLGCMKGGTSGYCWLDSLTWAGSDVRRYDNLTCATGECSFDCA